MLLRQPGPIAPARDTSRGPLPDAEDSSVELSGYPLRMVAADAWSREADCCPAAKAPQGQRAAAGTVTVFGEEMRRLMTERRVGLRELARQVSYDPGYLSKVANGRKAVSGDLARRLDKALGAGGGLEAFRAAPDLRGTYAYDDEQRLILAARRPGRLDREIIRPLAEELAAGHRQAHRASSAAMLKAVTAQLSLAGRLAREARAPQRGEALAIAVQYALFAGWLNIGAGRPADAGACLDRALGWAAETGDADMTATSLNLKAHSAWLTGKVGPMIGLSQAAQRSASISAGVRALAVQLEARANALTGNADDASRKLDEAAALMQRAAGHPRDEDEPPWSISFHPAHLALQRGLVCLYLGRNARAVESLSAGLAEMPPEVGQSEWIAWYHLRLAAAHARAGDAEQACSVAAQAALTARQTESSRLRAQLDRLLAHLSARWPTLPAVVDLSELMS
jgi:transcriptional regulator with XRE-family HTH domain